MYPFHQVSSQLLPDYMNATAMNFGTLIEAPAADE